MVSALACLEPTQMPLLSHANRVPLSIVIPVLRLNASVALLQGNYKMECVPVQQEHIVVQESLAYHVQQHVRHVAVVVVFSVRMEIIFSLT